MRVRVLNPTAEESVTPSPSAARMPSLAGRTIGLLGNGKIRVRELLDHVETLLRSQYGVAEVLRWRKPDVSRPAPGEMLDAMQRCDAVISAVGD